MRSVIDNQAVQHTALNRLSPDGSAFMSRDRREAACFISLLSRRSYAMSTKKCAIPPTAQG